MLCRFTLALAAFASCAVGDNTFTPVTRLLLTDGDPNFGGLSALLIAPDGQSGTTLSDRGSLFPLVFRRTPDGDLQSVDIGNGQTLTTHLGEDEEMDSEGLARTATGGLVVGFEQPSRLELINLETMGTAARHAFPNAQLRRGNNGLEAIATHPNGEFIVGLQEAPSKGEDTITLYALGPTEPAPLGQLPISKDFLVTGADFGPDGQLYILERAFSFLGFRTQIRRLDLDDDAAAPEVIFQSKLGDFDNLEGISVWQDSTGKLRISLVSDNNFLSILRSEFVELVQR